MKSECMKPELLTIESLKRKGEPISDYVDRIRAIQASERKVTAEKIAALDLSETNLSSVLSLFMAIQEAENAWVRKDGGVYPPLVSEIALLMHLEEMRRIVERAIKSEE